MGKTTTGGAIREEAVLFRKRPGPPFIVVSRKEVEAGDITPAPGTLRRLTGSPKQAKEFFERVDIGKAGGAAY